MIKKESIGLVKFMYLYIICILVCFDDNLHKIQHDSSTYYLGILRLKS